MYLIHSSSRRGWYILHMSLLLWDKPREAGEFEQLKHIKEDGKKATAIIVLKSKKKMKQNLVHYI